MLGRKRYAMIDATQRDPTAANSQTRTFQITLFITQVEWYRAMLAPMAPVDAALAVAPSAMVALQRNYVRKVQGGEASHKW
jgi:hypothetical protein